MENSEYLSVYDFVGTPAGMELGRKVATYASKSKIQLETREISNPNYTGKVLLYPKDFLEAFFQEPDPIESFPLDDIQDLDPMDLFTLGDIQDDDLPF